MPVPGRSIRPPLPLQWRVFFTNAAMLTAAIVALAVSPATVSFPIALTEGVILSGGLAAVLGLDLVLLRRALGSWAAGTSSATPGHDAWPPTTSSAVHAGDSAGVEGGVAPRLLVCWTRLDQLSEADAEAWTDAELTRVLAASGIDRARLMRLRGASPSHHAPWDCLLEVEGAPECRPEECIESEAWREWLGDLRRLGLRPVAVLADRGRVITTEDV